MSEEINRSTKGPGLPPGHDNCSSCGRVFATGDMVQLQGMWICAGCKPEFLQRLQEGLHPTGVMLWRSGKDLIMFKDAPLPERCIKCNGPAPGAGLKRNLTSGAPAIYLVILYRLLNPVAATVILVAAMVYTHVNQTRATVFVGICDRHRAGRRLAMGVAWGLIGVAGLLFLAAWKWQEGWTGYFGVVVCFGGIFWGLLGARVVHARRIGEKFLRLGGVGGKFLEALPEWKENQPGIGI